MKLRPKKAYSSYKTDSELAAGVMSRMGKKVREAFEQNPRKGESHSTKPVKERLAEEIRARRLALEQRGMRSDNQAVLSSLSKTEMFRSREERGRENAEKGFIRQILAQTVSEKSIDENGIHYEGFRELPNGRYQDLSTGKLVSRQALGERIAAFQESGFIPGVTELTYHGGVYRFHTEKGDWEIDFNGKDYTKKGGMSLKKV